MRQKVQRHGSGTVKLFKLFCVLTPRLHGDNNVVDRDGAHTRILASTGEFSQSRNNRGGLAPETQTFANFICWRYESVLQTCGDSLAPKVARKIRIIDE